MKLLTPILTISLFALVLASPANAKKTDGEILQDSVDSYTERMIDFADDFDEIQAITVPDDVDPEDRSAYLATEMYNAANPLFKEVLARMKTERTNTKYLKGISSLDKKNVRIELQEQYIELYSFQDEINDAITAETSSQRLNATRSALSKAESYLRQNEDSWHDSLLVFLKSRAEAFADSYEESLDNVDELYTAYNEILSDSQLEDLIKKRNRFSASYSDGIALLNRANNSAEPRRLQLYIRSINKFIKAKQQLERLNRSAGDLENILYTY